MWELKNPTIERAVLDFSSSGQAARSVSRLAQDGQVIFNAIELIDWEPRAFQATVCEACGIPGCASGGWVTLRSCGDLVLLLPAFDEMAEPRQRHEYGPPSYLLEHGAVYMTNVAYDGLRTLLPGLPRRGDLCQLRSGEAVSLFRFEAPYRVCGELPGDFTMRDENIVGASNGDAPSVIDQVARLAKAVAGEDRPVTLREPHSDEEVVSLYIDSFDFVDWRVIARSESTSYLMVASAYVLVTEAPSN